MRGVRGALVMLAVVGAVWGCGGTPSGQSPSAVVGSPSPTPTPTPRPSPTPKPEYQAYRDLAIGDCYDPVEDRDDRTLLAGIVRQCDEPHLAEVVGISLLDYPESAPFPAETVLIAEAEGLWRADFKSYVGIDFDDSTLDAYFYTPTEDSWGQGDRVVLCVVEATEVAPLTRSVRDSRI